MSELLEEAVVVEKESPRKQDRLSCSNSCNLAHELEASVLSGNCIRAAEIELQIWRSYQILDDDVENTLKSVHDKRVSDDRDASRDMAVRDTMRAERLKLTAIVRALKKTEKENCQLNQILHRAIAKNIQLKDEAKSRTQRFNDLERRLQFLSERIVPAQRNDQQNEPPHELLCPITLNVMSDPVVADDGFSYEREAIQRWLITHKTSPVTNIRLSTSEIYPNRALKRTIERFLFSYSKAPMESV